MAENAYCVKNDAAGFVFYVALESQAAAGTMQADPTLAAGDVQIALGDGAFANLATLPSVVPSAGGVNVKVTLSQAETNADHLSIYFSDATGDEWYDLFVTINPVTATRGLAGTALPDAVADAAGGLAISLAGSLDIDATDANVSLILADTGTDGVVLGADAITSDKIADNAIAAEHIAAAAIDAATFAADVDAEIRSYVGMASADLDTQLAAIQADLPIHITKNTELAGFPFKMVDETDGYTAETSKTVTETRSIDGAAFAACANDFTEIGSGWYKITLAATDLNGDTIILKFSASGCRDTEFTIITQP